MDYKEFLNLYKNKYQFFMWFLGAGVSVSAGIPSASNLIMQFKINIFCKNTGANPKLFQLHDKYWKIILYQIIFYLLK